MKKIIRIASVIALASASLLYVGCTKDFSADIAKTNQDVAALNQKIETLNSTVQTINSTVENLKTTKADLSAVNAKDEALDGKITALDGKLTNTKNDLTAAIATAKQAAIDAASADAATKLAAAKTELEGLISDVNKRADSLAIVTATTEDAVAILRADADTLKLRANDFERRIAELEDRVDALAARITSIVAVPSMSPEFQVFKIDTANVETTKDTTLFGATFAVTPKAAVKDIKAGNLKLNFKSGLTKGATPADSTVTNIKVAAINEEKGEITVFAGYEHKSIVKSAPDYSLYYSLEFTATDAASEKEYGVNSEYVKAHKEAGVVTLQNSGKVVVKNAEGEFVKCEGPLAVEDTADYTVSGYAFKKLLTTDTVTVAFEVNGKLLSAAELSKLAGRTVNVVVDTLLPIHRADSATFNVTNNGTTLKQVNGYKVGKKIIIRSGGFTVNDTAKFNAKLKETFVVGPHTLDPITLTPAKEEAWTKDSWNEINKTYSFVEGTNAKAIAKAIKGKFMPAADVEGGKITINYISENGVDVKIKDVNRPEKDSTYTITWKQKVVNPLGPNDSTLCQISWTYWIEAAPEGAEIDLGVKDTTLTVATETGGMVIPFDVDVVALTFEKLNAACQFDSTEFAEAKEAIKAAFAINSEDDLVVFNDKDSTVTASYTFDKVTVVNKRNIGTYVLSHSATVYGIKYTYTYKINVVKPATKFEAIDAYTTKEADGSYSIEVKGKVDSSKYVLNVIPFKDYFKLSSKEVTGLTVKFGQIDTTASKGKLNFPSIEQGEDSIHFGNGNIEWRNYDSLKVNVYAYLVAGADTIDQVKILFWSADPISVTAKDGVIKHQPNTADEFDLDSLIVMKDYNNSTVWDKDGKAGDVDYGQKVEFDKDQTNWTVNGKAWNNDLSLSIAEGSVLTLAADQATIVTPQVVRIPVKVSHKFNKFGDGYPAYVEVTITQK